MFCRRRQPESLKVFRECLTNNERADQPSVTTVISFVTHLTKAGCTTRLSFVLGVTSSGADERPAGIVLFVDQRYMSAAERGKEEHRT